MPTRLQSLQEIEAAVWNALGEAVRDKSHAWRTPVLATVDAGDGEPAADARTVVLREVAAAERELVVYSDGRAGKVRQLRAHPLGTLVFWSRELGWQLRCRCTLTIEDDGLAVSSRWAGIKASPAAQDYLSPLAPGSDLAGEAPPVGHREYFSVISARVVSMDWLELDARGHRRARFEAAGSRWLQP